MTCPKCRSENVNVQMVTETKLVRKHHGILWWLLVGWWWWPIYTVPAIIVHIFAPKRYKTKSKHKPVCVCQDCGHHWDA